MCIRDRKYGPFDIAILESGQYNPGWKNIHMMPEETVQASICLLYTSDAADERSSVDLGGRRIIKKKKNINVLGRTHDQ